MNQWVEWRSEFHEGNVLENDALTGRIIGAAITVHRELGPGFLESVYEEALALELDTRNIPFARQVAVPIHYRDRQVGEHRLDLVVNECVVVELKAVRELAGPVFRVMRSYLRASGLNVGLLLNFGTASLDVKRVFPDRRIREVDS